MAGLPSSRLGPGLAPGPAGNGPHSCPTGTWTGGAQPAGPPGACSVPQPSGPQEAGAGGGLWPRCPRCPSPPSPGPGGRGWRTPRALSRAPALPDLPRLLPSRRPRSPLPQEGALSPAFSSHVEPLPTHPPPPPLAVVTAFVLSRLSGPAPRYNA